MVFGLGLFVGGLATAVALAVPGSLVAWLAPPQAKAAIAAALGAVALAHDLRAWRLPLPTNPRMIPESRFRRSLARGGFLFGIELGLGFRTFVSSATAYVLAINVLLWADRPYAPPAIALGWAVGRWLPALSRLVSRDRAANNMRQMRFRFPVLGSAAVIAAGGLGLLTL